MYVIWSGNQKEEMKHKESILVDLVFIIDSLYCFWSIYLYIYNIYTSTIQ